MGIILLIFFMTLAAACGLLGASLGLAFGVLRRSALQGCLVGIPLLMIGGITGFIVAAAGMEGNAGNGIKWYGGEVEALFPISGMIAGGAVLIFIASFVIYLLRGPASRKPDRVAKSNRRR